MPPHKNIIKLVTGNKPKSLPGGSSRKVRAQYKSAIAKKVAERKLKLKKIQDRTRRNADWRAGEYHLVVVKTESKKFKPHKPEKALKVIRNK